MKHPQTEAFLELIQGRPQIHELDTEGARLLTRKTHFKFRPPMPEGVVQRDISIGPLRARLYRPVATADSLLPVLAWFHGGGWVVGDLDSHDVLCSELALFANIAVLSVEYRLAPEHRFPAGVEDAVFATRWLREHASLLAVDGARVAVGGDSAGGNLAIVTALTLRDAGEPPLRFQLLVYPSTGAREVMPSRKLYGDGLLLSKETIRWFGERYLNSKTEGADWRVSPALAPKLAGLPPTLIIAAALDPLVDEGKAFADRLREEGVPVQYSSYPGVIHGFFLMGKAFDAGRAAVQEAARALKGALS